MDTHHTPHTPQLTTTTRPQHHTETETERRPDKRREKIHFQCGGAWPFFVDGVLFLVNPVCARLVLAKQCQVRFIFDFFHRVVLRGDNVKDDSGSYAVFTEQGSSESQMTAAKVMDVIAKLPGCGGQAAYTQVTMESCPERNILVT